MKIENVLNAINEMEENCKHYPVAVIKIMDSKYNVSFADGMFCGEKLGCRECIYFTEDGLPDGTEFLFWYFKFPQKIEFGGVDSGLLNEEFETEVGDMRETLDEAMEIIQKYEQMEYEEGGQ